jgi:hypothetical protein
MRLTACDCNAASYRRIRRQWWMRVAWTRRLYRCYSCDGILLIPALAHRRYEDSGGLASQWPTTVILKGH